MVYAQQVKGEQDTFGVSGLLYKRNLLLYDRRTESLWSQLGGEAVAGPLAGTRLRLLPSTETTWSQWKEQHPKTLVLSFKTGYRRDYSSDPYKSFPLDRRMALVVRVGEQVKIYPFSQLGKAGPSLVDKIGGEKIVIGFDARNQTATARGLKGEAIPHFVAFLPDARAFYPHAPVFEVERRR